MGHTPGPWDKHILQRLTCGCVIMRSTSRAGGAYLVHCDLHAAAPALLAACEEAMGYLEEYGAWLEEYPGGDWDALVSQIEISIVQAKGKGDQCPTE